MTLQEKRLISENPILFYTLIAENYKKKGRGEIS